MRSNRSRRIDPCSIIEFQEVLEWENSHQGVPRVSAQDRGLFAPFLRLPPLQRLQPGSHGSQRYREPHVRDGAH